MKRVFQSIRRSPSSFIIGLLVLVAFVFIGVMLLRGLYSLLSFVAPVLVIAALIIRPSVVSGFLQMLWDRLRSQWVVGLAMILLTVLFFPFVSLYLLLRALMVKKVDDLTAEAQRQRDGSLTDYVDLSDEMDDTSSDIDLLLEDIIEKEKKYRQE